MFSFALLHAGLTALGASMAAHQRAAFRRSLSARAALGLQLTGWMLLTTATCTEIASRGWGPGLVQIFAGAAVSGFLLTVLLTFVPRRTPHLAAVLLLLGSGAALFP